MKKLVILLLLTTFTNLFSMSWFQRKPLNIETLKTRVAQRYKTHTFKPDVCRARISKDEDIDANINIYEWLYRTDTDTVFLACVATGRKNVIWLTDSDIEHLSDKELKHIILHEINNNTLHVYPLNTISERYKKTMLIANNAGKRHALLLLKAMPTEGNINAFQMGYFLGYHIDDLEFYYKIHTFMRMKDLYRSPKTHAGNFINWPKSLKDEFEQFEKEIWPKTNARKAYDQNKKATFDLEEQNKHLTDQELYNELYPTQIKARL